MQEAAATCCLQESLVAGFPEATAVCLAGIAAADVKILQGRLSPNDKGVQNVASSVLAKASEYSLVGRHLLVNRGSVGILVNDFLTPHMEGRLSITHFRNPVRSVLGVPD